MGRTRLWPLPRARYPKQFIRFFDREGRSLLGATLQRVKGEGRFSAPIVVCNNDHRFLVREELARAGTEPQAILLEPVARNTAAAVAAAFGRLAPPSARDLRAAAQALTTFGLLTPARRHALRVSTISFAVFASPA